MSSVHGRSPAHISDRPHPLKSSFSVATALICVYGRPHAIRHTQLLNSTRLRVPKSASMLFNCIGTLIRPLQGRSYFLVSYSQPHGTRTFTPFLAFAILIFHLLVPGLPRLHRFRNRRPRFFEQESKYAHKVRLYSLQRVYQVCYYSIAASFMMQKRQRGK